MKTIMTKGMHAEAGVETTFTCIFTKYFALAAGP